MSARRPAAAAAALACATACGDDPAAPAPLTTDVTVASGLAFRHETGASGRKYFVETNGSGAAWLDYDGDGDLDAYLVQGAALPGFRAQGPLEDRLFRNDGGRFTDVTAEAGLHEVRHGLAAAAPDYDGDGDADLFVTNFGPNVLLRNDGGRFTDVTAEAGVADGDRYHTACAFADFDDDGDLDLYVVGYVDFRLDDGKVCGDVARGEQYRTYCHPDMYPSLGDTLFRNDGDGTFTDVTKAAGLAELRGAGLGVTVADFDDDGDVDLFVANDADPNFLLRNDGELRFTDVAGAMSVDFNGEGRASSCMGTGFGDVDGDLDLDLFTVNLSNQYNNLWLREGDAFVDRSHAAGVAGPSLPFVGFGTVLADVDNDADLDLVIANGHVLDNAELVLTGTTWRQPAQIYWNDGRGRFRLATAAEAGGYFGEAHVGRGLAAADYDDDGDLDLLFTNNGEEAHLVRNDRGNRNAWIGFALAGGRRNRAAIGAEVRVTAGGVTQRRLVRAAESYLSFHDLRVLVGLGAHEGPVDVEVRWPGGRRERHAALAPRRYHRLSEPLSR